MASGGAEREPGPGLGVFCVITGDENRCRPDGVRKFFQDEVGTCRIMSSSRSYSNEKTFVTLEFSSRQNAMIALQMTGAKVNGCRISTSPFRSRRLGNLIGQDNNNHFGGHNGRFQHFNNRGGGPFRGNFNNRGGFFQQPFIRKGRSWGEQESEKVRGMSPKTAARYIENRIKQKEERTQQRQGRPSSYSRSRSHSRSHSRSLSPSPYRRSYSRHSSDHGSQSRSRSPRRRSRRSLCVSRSTSADSYSRGRRRGSRSQSHSYDDSASEERRSKERRRRHKKRKRRRRSVSSSDDQSPAPQPAANSDANNQTQELEAWATQDDVAIEHQDVGPTEVASTEAIVPAEVAVIDEVGTEDVQSPSLPALPSTQLQLAIPTTLPLQQQQDALQRRHSMQQEFEADVSTISSVAEMLRRHDTSIGVQLRLALQSTVNEVSDKYSNEFQDYLKTVVPGDA